MNKLLPTLLLTVIVFAGLSSLSLAYGQAAPAGTASLRLDNKLPTTTAGWESFMNTGSASAEEASTLGAAADRVNEMIFYALSHLGVRYQYGAQNPGKEFDCSGLVRWVFNRAWGLMLPRSSAEIAQEGRVIERDELRPGDLVFFNTLRRAYSHVGIYLGEGRFLHAPSAGGQVRIEDMNLSYWQQRWNGGRRLYPAQPVQPRAAP
jgi:cell wall-associated NlpC family hydrolase